jgi:hypothetical protein
MKHNLPIAVAALAVFFGGCNARTGARNANTVTVAGCVQSAEQGLGSKDKNDIDKFILTNASLTASGAANSTAPRDQARPTPNDQARPAPNEATANDRSRADAGPATATLAGASGNFMLDGKASELREHLNQQVEITGRVDRDNDRDKNAKDQTASSQAPKLNVDSIRTVAANCSR